MCATAFYARDLLTECPLQTAIIATIGALFWPLQFIVYASNTMIYAGPKTNSVEKLAELRNAGVNIGAARFFLGRTEKLRKLNVLSRQCA